MASELILRFVIGGLVVSAFAVLGDVLRPKTFAGIFGAAPSVALASLGLVFIARGGAHASIEGRSMALGGVALVCYSLVVARLLLRHRWNTVAATTVTWLLWLAVAFGLWAVLAR